MAATWRISDGSDGTTWDDGYTLAEQGITDLKIRFCNHADDVATWTAEGEGLANAPFWSHGAAIKIWKGTECVFCGVVTSLPRYGTGTGQRHRFEARGGWYWLTKGFYTQVYKVRNDDGTTGDCSKTRVIIGYGASGRATPNAQLAEIVNQCAARTGRIAPVTHGDWDDGEHNIDVATVRIPGDEEVDLTWADALNRILRWFPDTSVWFTYGTGKAVCWMVRRSAIPNRVNDIALLEEVEVTPRHDLVVPGVRIDYEVVTEVTDQEDETQTHRYRKVVSRTAGSPDAIGAAHFTVELDGGTETHLKQKILAENLPATLPVASGSIPGSVWQDFFRKYIPELADRNIDSFICNNQPWFPRGPYGVALPRVLLRGEVQPWMNRTAQETRLDFVASYHDGANQWIDRTFSVTLTLTNAATGTYTAKTRTDGENVPNGLAAQVFAAVGTLYWEGRISRIGEDPPDIGMPGESIDLSGGRPEWYAHDNWPGMDSPVQSTEWDVGAGKTTVAFGPPEHLGLQDLIQLAQANRKRQAVKSQGTKASADEDDDPDDGMTIGGAGPNTHGGETEGKPVKRKLVAVDSSLGKNISIDADATNGSGESSWDQVVTGQATGIYAGAIKLVNPTRGDVVLPGKFSTTDYISGLLTDGDFLIIRGAPTMSGSTQRGHWTEGAQSHWIPGTLTVGGQIPVATLCVRGGIVLGAINQAYLDFTSLTVNLPDTPDERPSGGGESGGESGGGGE